MNNSYSYFIRQTRPRFIFKFWFASLILVIFHLQVLGQDFTTISWGTAASQRYPVSEAQGKAVNGKLYSFGGFDCQKSTFTPTKRSYVYDPLANTWAVIADLPYIPNGENYGGVTHAGITTDGTDIYIAGGYTSSTTGSGQIFGTKQVWKYVISQNSYTRLPDLPISIASGQLEYLDGKLHHIGGTNSSRTLDLGDHYVLDLNNLPGGWSTLAPLPNPRHHAGSAVYGGKIYFIGGQRGHDSKLITQKDVHVYNPSNNTWTKVAHLPVPTGATGRGHISSAVTVMGERIFVLGGETVHGTSVKMVSAYSPAANSWADLTPLPANRFSGVAATINNILYYTGGSRSSTTYKGIPAGQTVSSFTLINADTEEPLQTLTNGSTLNLAALPTRNLNIRANTNPAAVGSVVFNLTGTEIRNVTESRAPYALFGDDNSGDYYAWKPATGNYSLKATPYSASGGTGTPGTALNISFAVTDETTQSITLSPTADAFVRNGSFAGSNYGNDTSLIVKGSASSGYTRTSYLKFSLSSVSNISSAKLRIYGRNTENTTTISFSSYGADNDSWTETGITFNNAPAASTSALSSAGVNNVAEYYELDVTSYVKTQFTGDKIVSFLIKDPANQNKNLVFNSKENANNRPQLVVESSQNKPGTTSTAEIFNIERNSIKPLVYPNPFQKQFNIRFPNSYKGDYYFTIADQTGRTYNLGKIRIQPGGSNINIDISKFSLRPGVYFLKINSETKSEEMKLIVQ